MEANLVPILQRIESSFVKFINLKFLLDTSAALASFNWQSLERVLLMHHFGLKLIRVVVVLEDAIAVKQESVERWIRRVMSDLESRDILDVRVIQ
jgi:hypothetical protein